MRYTAQLALWLGLMLAGCEATNPHEEALELAEQRFNLQKAKIKFLLATEQFATGQVDKAKISVQEAIGLHPDDPAYYRLLVRIHIEKGELSRARKLLDELMVEEEPNGELSYLTGLVAERHGNLPEALAAYRRAHELQPEKTDYLMAWAEALLTLQRPDEALSLIEDRMQRADHIGRLQTLKGDALQMLHRYEEAAAAYRKALIEYPGDPLLLEAYATALFQAKRYADAIPAFRAYDVALKEPTPLPALRSLAACYMETGDHPKAMSYLRDLTALQPDDVHSWQLLARCALAMDNLGAARHAAEQAVRIGPYKPGTQMMLGYVLFQLQEWREARRALQAAIRVEPRDTVALCLLGQISEVSGVPHEAMEFYRRALQVDPDDELARHLHAQLQDPSS